MLRRWSLPLAALCVLLAVSGCTDEPEPRFADPTSGPSSPATSSRPPTSEPTSTEPTNNAPDPSQAPETVVRAWVKARNEVVQGGEVATLNSLSTSDCETCQSSVAPVLEVYANGGRYETDGWRIEAIERDPGFRSNSQLVVALVYDAGRTFESRGAEPVSYSEENHLAVFTMAKTGSSWRVADLAYVS